jgi:hypothetical protein
MLGGGGRQDGPWICLYINPYSKQNKKFCNGKNGNLELELQASFNALGVYFYDMCKASGWNAELKYWGDQLGQVIRIATLEAIVQ